MLAEKRELSSDLVKTNEVINVTVKNDKLEKLGKIEEIILDKVNGQVRYVVLSFGGILGIGDKFFALPWSMFHYNKNEECFILNIEKEKLAKAPGFDKSHWPNMSLHTWEESIFKYYDVNPYWK